MAIVGFSNFSNFLAYPLTALAGFGLAYYITRNKYASFLAGLIFSFSYYHVLMGRGFMSTNHLEFIPLYYLSLLYALDKKTIASIVLSALALSIAFMCNAYLAFFCGLFSVFFFLFDKAGFSLKIFLKYYLLTMPILLITNINFFVSQIRVFNHENFMAIGRNFVAENQTVNILSFFSPSSTNWLYSFYGAGDNFLGYAALALALVGLFVLRQDKRYFLFFFCFCLSILLASNVPGLFFVNKIYFAIFGMFRAVSRLNLVTSLFLALMASMVFNHFSRKYLCFSKKEE